MSDEISVEDSLNRAHKKHDSNIDKKAFSKIIDAGKLPDSDRRKIQKVIEKIVEKIVDGNMLRGD